MSDIETQSVDDVAFPPGTVRLSDRADTHLVLAPQPTSDPNDPLNWSSWRKGVEMTLLCLYGIMVYGFLTISPVLWLDMNIELGFSYTILNDSYGVSAATLGVGCIVFTPFALRFGRRPIYIITSLIIFGMDIWSAKMTSVADIMLTNAFMGLAGSVNEALFQMTVNDLFFVHQRGTMNGLLFVCSTIGNYFAPVAGGYVALSQGWRWAFWYLAIFQGIISVLIFFFLEETKYLPDAKDAIVVPVSAQEDRKSVTGQGGVVPDMPHEDMSEKGPVNEPRSEEIRRESVVSYNPGQDAAKRRLVEIDNTIPKRPLSRRYALLTRDATHPSSYEWWRHLTQPFALLFLFPAVAFAAVQWAFCLSALSLVAVSTSDLYPLPPYNFSSVGVGNLNIPPAIGYILGIIWGGPVVDWTIVRLAQRNGGIYEPEMRLVLFILPGTLMPIGVFMYGLCTAKGMAWIIPSIGSAFIGFAIGGTGDIALTYVQDAYTAILPDSLIGIAFVRNIMATILVFVIQPWFNGMGVYNAFILLGCISIAFSLTAIPIYVWGKKFRTKCAARYRYYAGKQFVVRSL